MEVGQGPNVGCSAIRKKRIFVEDMWMLTSPHPVVLVLRMAVKMKPCFTNKEDIIRYVLSIFPPRII
jgi:hypothetical protein